MYGDTMVFWDIHSRAICLRDPRYPSPQAASFGGFENLQDFILQNFPARFRENRQPKEVLLCLKDSEPHKNTGLKKIRFKPENVPSQHGHYGQKLRVIHDCTI